MPLSEREKRERLTKLLEPADLRGEAVTARDMETWRADLLSHLQRLERLREDAEQAARDSARHAEEMIGALDEGGNLIRLVLAVALGHPIHDRPAPPRALHDRMLDFIRATVKDTEEALLDPEELADEWKQFLVDGKALIAEAEAIA